MMGNIFLFLLMAATPQLGWKGIEAKIAADFPETPTLTIAELKELQSSSEEELLLIDVRAEEEFAVSHLKGAYNLEKAAEIALLLQKHAPDRVILYCSVGYRSAQATEELRKLGFNNVYNLHGSIFAWGNQGEQVYGTALDNELPAEKIHPYDAYWGKLLNSELHSFEAFTPPPSPQKNEADPVMSIKYTQ